MTTVSERYQEDINAGYIQQDSRQLAVLRYFDRVHNELLQAHRPANLLMRLAAKWQTRPTVKGLYLWGGVGIGKTYMMDLFYESVPFANKQRIHFHRFMQQIHQGLKALQGQSDPLQQLAKDIAQSVQLICFDEFFVNDITDAMLLGNLFQALFAHGVCLVATSNVAPDDLYKNGLQRALFLPAIALLKKHTEVVHFDSLTDYRLRTLEQAGVYFTPLDKHAESAMQGCFNELTHHHFQAEAVLTINNRDIQTIASGSGVVWFDFEVICSVPRSQQDYLEIAKQYHTVLMSNVPEIREQQDDKITYLINLVDVFYDQRVKLIVSAATPIEKIYQQGRLAFAFQRTQSRLLEMQSREYLHEEHLI